MKQKFNSIEDFAKAMGKLNAKEWREKHKPITAKKEEVKNETTK